MARYLATDTVWPIDLEGDIDKAIELLQHYKEHGHTEIVMETIQEYKGDGRPTTDRDVFRFYGGSPVLSTGRCR